MHFHDVDRTEFIGSSDPSPVYRVTFTGDENAPEPYRNTEEQIDVSDASNVAEVLAWAAENALSRGYQVALKAWDVDPDTGFQEECLYELI